MAKISKNNYDELAHKIASLFDLYDEGRQSQKDNIENLERLIFEAPIEKNEKQFILPTMYKNYDTMVSYINETIYQNNETLFDVKGNDYESQQNSQTHKFDIIATLDNMRFKDIMIDCVHNFALSGELIAFVGLGNKVKYVKKPISPEELSEALDKEIPLDEINPYKVVEKTIYSGPMITAWKSENFVFNVAKRNDFDKAEKIYRSLVTYNEVINNSNYKINPETKEYFSDLVFAEQPSFNELSDNLKEFWTNRNIVENGMLEHLQFWGDLEIVINGQRIFLENYIIEVVAGKVVRCESNPFYSCPIVYYAEQIDPKTKRGLARLLYAVNPHALNTNITNVIIEILQLLQNPMWLAQKGILEDTEIIRKAGKIITWDAEINPQAMPQKIDDSASLTASVQAVQIFDNEIQEATGLYDNLAGALAPAGRTATELQLTTAGGSVRINNMTDKIKNNFNIPLIERIVDLKANTELEAREVAITGENNERYIVEIKPEVNQGDYKYTYMDNKTATQRQANMQSFIQFAQMFLQAVPNDVNISELFKLGASQFSIENVDKIFKKNAIDTALDEINQQQFEGKMQPQDKEAVKSALAQYLPQVFEQMSTQGVQNEQPTV